MYLTAQRVTSRETTGINVFLYRHGRGKTPLESDGYPDLSSISVTTPGDLFDQEIEVKPGGNRVESFLDVASDDDIDPEILVRCLGVIEEETSTTAPVPWEWEWRSETDPIVVRFYTSGDSSSYARAELVELSRRLIGRLQVMRPPLPGQPYRFRLVRTADGYTLRCDPDTRARLQREGRAPAADSLSISTHVSTSMAPFLAHAIAALMNRDLHELVASGGVEVLDDEGTRVWHRLPPGG